MVEDISENYIEKPFLAAGTFTEFIKNAIDVVQCRRAHASLALFSFPHLTWPNILKPLHLHDCRLPLMTVMTTACRMKPNYMGPDSPVRREFMEFCAANPMDSESLAP